MKKDKNKLLKIKYLEYYAVLPIQKLGAEYIGRSADTIQNWMKEDGKFSAQAGLLKAEWAQKTAKRVRNPEWLLERIMNDHFSQKSNLDITSDGKEVVAFNFLPPVKDGKDNTDNKTTS